MEKWGIIGAMEEEISLLVGAMTDPVTHTVGGRIYYEGTIEESYYVALDRPFIYMIVDSNNLPLFIGTYQ